MLKIHTVDFYQYVTIPVRNHSTRPQTTRVGDENAMTTEYGVEAFYCEKKHGVILKGERLEFDVFVNNSNIKSILFYKELPKLEVKPEQVIDNSSLPKEVESKKKIVKTKQKEV